MRMMRGALLLNSRKHDEHQQQLAYLTDWNHLVGLFGVEVGRSDLNVIVSEMTAVDELRVLIFKRAFQQFLSSCLTRIFDLGKELKTVTHHDETDGNLSGSCIITKEEPSIDDFN